MVEFYGFTKWISLLKYKDVGVKTGILFFLIITLFSISSKAKSHEAELGGFIVQLKSEKAFNKLKVNFPKARKLKIRRALFAKVSASSKQVKFIKEIPGVLSVQKNAIVTLDTMTEAKSIFNASQLPTKGLEWGLTSSGANIYPAWHKTTGRKEVIVAVIDTGVDYKHPSLRENIYINEAEANGEPGVDDDGNGYVDDIRGYDFVGKDNDPMDKHSHGTHCAGIIAAMDTGTSMVGASPNVKIMPVQIFSRSGRSSVAAIAEAIDYAVTNGAQILSMSFGGGQANEAIKQSMKNAFEARVLAVVAAGNSRSDNDVSPMFPASYEFENIISVGAHDQKSSPARFSNYGKETVDIFAPGVDILSTVPNKKFALKSGTSMATPFVSGAMALLLSLDPSITPDIAKRRLLRTSLRSDALRGKSLYGSKMDVERLIYDI